MKSMKHSILQEKTYSLALESVKIYKTLTMEKREFILSKQFLRSATSIGANIQESSVAQSNRDFLTKITISLKEAKETEYWINLLADAGYLDFESQKTLSDLNGEIIRMLIASVKPIRNRINQS
jgi:four helix bundle protein